MEKDNSTGQKRSVRHAPHLSPVGSLFGVGGLDHPLEDIEEEDTDEKSSPRPTPKRTVDNARGGSEPSVVAGSFPKVPPLASSVAAGSSAATNTGAGQLVHPSSPRSSPSRSTLLLGGPRMSPRTAGNPPSARSLVVTGGSGSPRQDGPTKQHSNNKLRHTVLGFSPKKGNQHKNVSNNPRASLFSSKLAGRSTAVKLRLNPIDDFDDGMSRDVMRNVPRRYNTGDHVLVWLQGRITTACVNKFGFPPGEGNTPDERSGPYMYALAVVKQIHFEEIALYYTVTRCDTGQDQRAESESLEPIRSERGKEAALRVAAGESSRDGAHGGQDVIHEHSSSVCFDAVQFLCYLAVLPFAYFYDWCVLLWFRWILPFGGNIFRRTRATANLFLNGLEPFLCRMRLTIVNVVVLCSLWYMFIDQLRLAVFPASADDALASVNFTVWVILVAELLIEVFVRPEGYNALLASEKAYAPATARYVNLFHLAVEGFSLVLFHSEFICLFYGESCSSRLRFSFHNAAMKALTGPTIKDSFYGRAYMALIRLRIFGLVRHWRNMWITNSFMKMKWKSSRGRFASLLIPSGGLRTFHDRNSLSKIENLTPESREEKIKDLTLTNASNIGTALLVTNSYRALAIAWIIVGFFPLLIGYNSASFNPLAIEMTKHVQALNVMAVDSSAETCDFLRLGVNAWMKSVAYAPYWRVVRKADMEPFLLIFDMKPHRCDIQDGELTTMIDCNNSRLIDLRHDGQLSRYSIACDLWAMSWLANNTDEVAGLLGLRGGSIMEYNISERGSFTDVSTGVTAEVDYSVFTVFDLTHVISSAATASLLIQALLLVGILGGLSFLRHDAEVLVLRRLRKMLKIVARYAKNPLASPPEHRRHAPKQQNSSRNLRDDESTISDHTEDFGVIDNDENLGSFETKKLTAAIARITDLLRKCWGVAGANIISTNLATREGALTEVFNPTVPGTSVYALFAFAAINGFDYALRNLGGDIMVLINDIANVLHGDVFRWAFGDSGQCNKNLGAAFLMVFRIGLVEDVVEKLEQAQEVIFSTKTNQTMTKRRGRTSHFTNNSSGQSNRKASDKNTRMSLSLQSLPGINQFTDRAVLGMLKSFAGIHRDSKVLNWNNDFRLSSGVGTFRVSLIYGMDAGWAVEGAVGSEYKIDATYLSPHVNMASRMMSACKQYGVTIMLSQAVQELMSEPAKAKLRHVDTVTVKGSSVKQRIYTYDCKAKGVDFFLYSRTDEQADADAERYSPNMWNTDQDLRAMRQHVTEDFLKDYREGHKAYLSGNWSEATRLLESANEIMFQTAVEEGYLEDEFNELQIYAGQDFSKAAAELKRDNGDGPSTFLLSFMADYGGKAPDRWEGWHPLTRK